MACTHVPAQRSVVDGAHAATGHTDLAATPHAAPLARIFVREHLRNHVPAAVLETTMLLTTELVTNAVLHAKTSIHLGITWDEHNLLVTVQDHNLQTPGDRHQVDGDHLRETGRGLVIVESLADDFGWSRLPNGNARCSLIDVERRMRNVYRDRRPVSGRNHDGAGRRHHHRSVRMRRGGRVVVGWSRPGEPGRRQVRGRTGNDEPVGRGPNLCPQTGPRDRPTANRTCRRERTEPGTRRGVTGTHPGR